MTHWAEPSHCNVCPLTVTSETRRSLSMLYMWTSDLTILYKQRKPFSMPGPARTNREPLTGRILIKHALTRKFSRCLGEQGKKAYKFFSRL